MLRRVLPLAVALSGCYPDFQFGAGGASTKTTSASTSSAVTSSSVATSSSTRATNSSATTSTTNATSSSTGAPQNGAPCLLSGATACTQGLTCCANPSNTFDSCKASYTDCSLSDFALECTDDSMCPGKVCCVFGHDTGCVAFCTSSDPPACDPTNPVCGTCTPLFNNMTGPYTHYGKC